MRPVIVDSGVLVSGFLGDEPASNEARLLVDAYGEGLLSLLAPTVLPHELTNAILKAVRRARIAQSDADDVFSKYAQFEVSLCPVDPAHAYGLAQRFGRSAYDAAYLALAEQEGLPLITADERLYNAVKGSLPWVVWLPEWRRHIDTEATAEGEGADDE